MASASSRPVRSRAISRRHDYAAHLSCSCPQQAGLGDVWDDIGKQIGGAVEAKTKQLELALKVIIGLSAVAALTGIVTVIRGRR